MEHATWHLYFLRIHTRLKARVYTENTSDAWHIPRYPTRKHCITSMYCTLFHTLKSTANLRPGLLLHILGYATGNSIPLYFPVITCVQQFTGVHLRTSQKPAPKLFNSYEPLRTFPITSRNFPKISEHFRRFPKIFRKF